jgi:hypothetical protein
VTLILGSNIILPEDNVNFRRVKGPKLKQVGARPPTVPELPPLETPEGSPIVSKLSSDIPTIKNASHIPKRKTCVVLNT